MNEKERRKLWIAKNFGATIIYENMRKKAATTQLNEDSQRRKKINKIIMDGIRVGKGQEEIEKELLSNPEFEKYSIYFKNWINDQYKKSFNCQKGNLDNEQERD